jgi:hypothetical protein
MRSGQAFTAAQGPRFGPTVAAAFLVLAAIAWWRDQPNTFAALATLGGLLVAGRPEGQRRSSVQRQF